MTIFTPFARIGRGTGRNGDTVSEPEKEKSGGRVPRPERPLDPGDDLLTEFAADLRRLRESAGNPTYRELGRRAHYSAGTLSDAAGGRKLPSLAVTLAYVRACGGEPGEWEEQWHAVAEEKFRLTSASPHSPQGTGTRLLPSKGGPSACSRGGAGRRE